MKEIFKQLIIDFHKAQLPKPSYRAFDLPNLPPNIRKAHVLVGMRRSGKTWTLYQQMQSLLKQGTQIEQMLYLNFADDRLPNITSDNLQKILDAYFELYPQNINQPNVHFFFDEIQEVSGWEKFIRRLLDTEKMTIYITGSSAKMLSKEIASALRGRTIVREIFPFSFAEYLQFNNAYDLNGSVNIHTFVYDDGSGYGCGQGDGKGDEDGSGYGGGDEYKHPLSTPEQQIIKHHLQKFLHCGGFPEACAMHRHSNLASCSMFNNQFRELLQGYVNSVVQRDIIDRYNLKNSVLVRELCTICLKNSAKLFSVNKSYKDLKSQDRKVSKKSLYDLMKYFEDAYCIFSIPTYNFSFRKTTNIGKKIYPVDQGLVTAYTIKNEYEDSARMETAVFSHLRRNHQEVYYYKTDSGKEIDFLVTDTEGKQVLYQVALNLHDPATLHRETAALKEAMIKFGVNLGTIVTLDDERVIEVPAGKIQCVPIWKLLLGLAE